LASFSASGLGAGSHDITAVYSPSGSFSSSTSGITTQQVDPCGTTVTLASTGSPSLLGQTLTFTAAVSAAIAGAGTPGGTITFVDGTTALGTVTVVGGTAQLDTTALPLGSHSVTAIYNGSPNFAPSPASNAVTPQVVDTTTSLTSGGSPSVFGQ